MGTATITEWGQTAALEGGISLTVDFDPKSLQLSYSPTGTSSASTVTESGTWNKTPPQQTGQGTTLSVDLTFDTSTTGASVEAKTGPLVALTDPRPTTPGKAPARRVVLFHWGSFLFFGMVQSMSQTIDFFTDTGIPLRSAVHLTLSKVDRPNPASAPPAPSAPPASFGSNAGISASASLGVSASAGVSAGFSAGGSASAVFSAGFSGDAGVGTTPLTLSQAGDTVAAITARAGAGVSWKAVAAANGIENPRLLPPGTVLNASADATLT